MAETTSSAAASEAGPLLGLCARCWGSARLWSSPARQACVAVVNPMSTVLCFWRAGAGARGGHSTGPIGPRPGSRAGKVEPAGCGVAVSLSRCAVAGRTLHGGVAEAPACGNLTLRHPARHPFLPLAGAVHDPEQWARRPTGSSASSLTGASAAALQHLVSCFGVFLDCDDPVESPACRPASLQPDKGSRERTRRPGIPGGGLPVAIPGNGACRWPRLGRLMATAAPLPDSLNLPLARTAHHVRDRMAWVILRLKPVPPGAAITRPASPSRSKGASSVTLQPLLAAPGMGRTQRLHRKPWGVWRQSPARSMVFLTCCAPIQR